MGQCSLFQCSSLFNVSWIFENTFFSVCLETQLESKQTHEIEHFVSIQNKNNFGELLDCLPLNVIFFFCVHSIQN